MNKTPEVNSITKIWKTPTIVEIATQNTNGGQNLNFEDGDSGILNS